MRVNGDVVARKGENWYKELRTAGLERNYKHVEAGDNTTTQSGDIYVYPQDMDTDMNKRQYNAMIWITGSNQAGKRVTIYAGSLDEAKQQLESEYGKGNVYYLHNQMMPINHASLKQSHIIYGWG